METISPYMMCTESVTSPIERGMNLARAVFTCSIKSNISHGKGNKSYRDRIKQSYFVNFFYRIQMTKSMTQIIKLAFHISLINKPMSQ